MANLLGEVAIELERIERANTILHGAGKDKTIRREWLLILLGELGQAAHWQYLGDRGQVRQRLIRLAGETLAAVEAMDRAT